MSCAIHASGLSYSYPGGHAALASIDLHITHGERVALLGPNGAGKTTFLLHLNGLLRGGGALEVAGIEVGNGDLAELRARVGIVFQDPDDQLFMPTVAEDVAFGPLNLGLEAAAVEERIDAALAAVRMSVHRERAPHHLSMGERRRVAIATVLAMEPDLLILDEPSANLDPRSREDLIEVLAAIEGTMLIATHDLPLAIELCERATILDGGRVVADGPTRGLAADDELLGAHDLRLPNGFDPARVRTRAASASGRERGPSPQHEARSHEAGAAAKA